MVEGKSSEGGLWFRTKVRAAGGAGAGGRALAGGRPRRRRPFRDYTSALANAAPHGDKDKHGGARVT